MIPEENHALAQKLGYALSYPFPKPPHDFLMLDGRSLAIEEIPPGAEGGDVASWVVRRGVWRGLAGPLLAEAGIKNTLFENLTPVLAVGSNASPVQLARKFHHLPGELALCLSVRVKDVVSVYAGHIASYGSIPATLERADGATTRLILNFLSKPLLEQMHATENLGEHYELTEVHALTYDRSDAPPIRPSLAYQSPAPGFPFRVAGLETQGSELPAVSQWDMQEYVIRLLGLASSVERFILENIADGDLRAAREREMREKLLLLRRGAEAAAPKEGAPAP